MTWTYDATNRLNREQRSGSSAYDTTYTYDPLGNRLVKDASGVLTTSTYDLANQLVTSQDANGATTYTYDLAGNLHIVEHATGQRTTTTWDDQNRQTGVLFPDGSAVTNTFRFDGLRYSKQEPQATTKFIWDFENYLAETDDQDELHAVYTNEPQQYGNLISQYRKGPTLWLPSYYHYDALGATRVLTDDAGDVTDTYLYDAWGNELAVSGSTVNPLRWVGQVGYYWDESNGRFYIRARVYEPVIGRWMSQDPVTHGVNLYPYASNSPLTLTDPTGLVPTIKLSLTSFENRACGFIRTAWLMTFNPLKARALMVSHLCYDCTFVDCEKEAGCCTRARRRVDRPGNCIYETFVLQVGEFGFQDHNTHRIYSFQRCSSRGHVAVANNIRIYSYAALEALPEPARSEAMHWEQQALGNRFPRATFTRCGDTVQITSGHSSQPPFWDNAKAIVAATYRSWRIRWDCCNLKTRKQEFEAYTDDRGIRRDIFERNY
ncbi:MAG: hypothetical protein KJ000_10000 [Pirellulaceae bacterium]|nr:hypothetical protein [Pirellulaceae bacterium]